MSPVTMKSRRRWKRNIGALDWRLIHTYVAVTICTVMTDMDSSHRILWFIGLVLATIFGVNALGAIKKYIKAINHRWRRKGRRQRVPSSLTYTTTRGGRSFGLPVLCSPPIVYNKMQHFDPTSRSPPIFTHPGPMRYKRLRSWYRSSAYAYNFPARREEYMTDLKILETFLRSEEKKERYAQLCGILASSLTFWGYRPYMEYYICVQRDYQYMVPWCMLKTPLPHRRRPPGEEKRFGQ